MMIDEFPHSPLDSLTIYTVSPADPALSNGCTTDLVFLQFLIRQENQKEVSMLEDSFLQLIPIWCSDE